mmetsp:Transcript_5218/g.5345  ORF Transcript_5218/g.5345 Transcript_5218/m.5345 type:complete len:119 (+) Transcript_5218:1-357(+)
MKVASTLIGGLLGLYTGVYLRENTNIRQACVQFKRNIFSRPVKEMEHQDDIFTIQRKIDVITSEYSNDVHMSNIMGGAIDKRRIHEIDREYEKIMNRRKQNSPLIQSMEQIEKEKKIN